jgi:cell division GTPase FtsZ
VRKLFIHLSISKITVEVIDTIGATLADAAHPDVMVVMGIDEDSELEDTIYITAVVSFGVMSM